MVRVTTIAARNYLPFARQLASSFRAHNRQDSFTILLVDAAPGEVSDTDDFVVATPADLPLSSDEFKRMALLYDVTELSTALKPWALEMLLEQGADTAVYLDPDILVYDELSEIERLSLEHGIVLTPHGVTPMPRDGLRPSEADIMGSGIYNLGFIAVGQRNRDMLQWWQERLRRDSISAPDQMLFTDQRWIDLVPGYWHAAILRDPGYNVAYWNLENRPITKNGDQVLVDGRPLRFFHFSGYRPDKPWILSKHAGERPRVLLSEAPVVRELCDGYGALVNESLRSQGQPEAYRFNALSDGTVISRGMRRVYRAEVLASDAGRADPPPVPFDDDADLVRWFMEPDAGQPVGRLLRGVWQSRPDLQRAFPLGLGRDAGALLAWARTSGVREGEIPAMFLSWQPAVESLPAPPVSVEAPGVNLAGYFRAELGVGQSGRLLVDAVKKSGLPYSTLVSNRTVSRTQAEFTEVEEAKRYPVNIAVVNADQFGLWTDDVGDDLLANRYTIGVWAWEVEEFPDAYHFAFDLVDEVWAVSEFVRDAIAAKTTLPVHVFPHPIPLPEPSDPNLDRAALGIGPEPYFLFVFDYLSVFERKNPLALVEAFRQAFPASAAAQLVIKTINGDRCRVDRERLRLAVAGHPHITLLEEYLPAETVEALMRGAAAYVSLHRSEGYGLTLSESMALGRPVIATGYSGNLDFMNQGNSLLVPSTLVPVAPGSGPYPPSTRWAEPDIAAAAALMQRVIDDPEWAESVGRKARDSVARAGATERAADFVTGRVEAIMAARAEQRSASDAVASIRDLSGPSAETKSAIQRARELIHTAPDVSSPSRLPWASRRARQLMYRGLAHHDEEVNRRLDAVLTAVQETHETAVGQGDSVAGGALSEQPGMTARLDDHASVLREQQDQLGALHDATRAHADRQDDLTARVDQLHAEYEAMRTGHQQLAGRVDQLNAEYEAMRTGHQQLAGRVDQLNAEREVMQTTQSQLGGRADQLASRVDRLDLEMAAAPYAAEGRSLQIADAGGVHLGFTSDEGEASYAGFEDIFRGSEDFVRARLLPYVDVLKEHGPVLDVGCGRGELLGVLADNDIDASGVDLDASMLERARTAGHSVTLGDGVEYLRGLSPRSLGAVVCIEVVEHLDLQSLRELFGEAARVLKPGGLLVAETVNPHSPAALKTFWLDLTHVRPLYPEALLLLARESGFSEGTVLFPHGSGDLEADLRDQGEYALVATL